MQIVDLRLDARWVVPVVPRGALAAHSVIVDAGRILAVAPTADAERAYDARVRVTLATHALLPGLVNAHTHAAMTLLRGSADDIPLKPWLEDHIWPRERAFLSDEFVHDGTLLAVAEMLLGGITCCNDQYFFADAAARAYRAGGMRAMLGLAVLDFPTAYAADAEGYLRAGLAARDAWKHEPLLTFSLAPHAPYTVGDATWRKIVVYARQLDLPIQTHLLETRDERARSESEFGLDPLRRLHRLGVTGPGFIAVHGTYLDASDMALLETQGCHVVHCPASNLKLASGIAPVAALALGASMSRWAPIARPATTVSTCSAKPASRRCWPREQRRCRRNPGRRRTADGHTERGASARTRARHRIARARQAGGRDRGRSRRGRARPLLRSGFASDSCHRTRSGHRRLGRRREGGRPGPADPARPEELGARARYWQDRLQPQ